MKKILLHTGNRERIEDALRQVNGRATAHTITCAVELVKIAEDAEAKMLHRGASKTSLKGAQVAYTPPGPGKAYAKSGKRVITTSVVLERSTMHWGLITAERDEIWADSSESRCIRLPVGALERISDAALGDVVGLNVSDRSFGELLRRAFKIATLPCESAHEKMAILKLLES